MRYSRTHKEEAKLRILEAAGRGFRKEGVGIGVDALAKEAGVTSGAFYGHFRSKAEAFRMAVAAGLVRLRSGIETFQLESGPKWIAALADYYLGAEHRNDLAGGCALPSLSADAGRGNKATRTIYQTELLGVVEAITKGLPIKGDKRQRNDAWVMLALLAGGVLVSRGVRDEALADEIAAAVHEAVIRLGS